MRKAERSRFYGRIKKRESQELSKEEINVYATDCGEIQNHCKGLLRWRIFSESGLLKGGLLSWKKRE